MKLFIDDLRPEPYGWERRRTITDAVRLLHSGVVEELSLDHDICHETVPGGETGGVCTCPENYGALAYVVAMMSKDMRPKKVWLHSANPGGRDNMRAILKSAGVVVEDRPIDHPYGDYVGPDITEKK